MRQNTTTSSTAKHTTTSQHQKLTITIDILVQKVETHDIMTLTNHREHIIITQYNRELDTTVNTTHIVT